MNKFKSPLFKQHIPSFCSGFKPKKFEFKNLEKVLKEYPINKSKEFFCYSNYHDTCQLLILDLKENNWIVLGYVYNFDLSKHLPKFIYREPK